MPKTVIVLVGEEEDFKSAQVLAERIAKYSKLERAEVGMASRLWVDAAIDELHLSTQALGIANAVAP